MKYLYFSFSLVVLAALASCSSSRTYSQGNYPENNYAQDNPPQQSPITYQEFYDDLSPYGNWVNYQNYGYVWVPNVSGFRPYYNNGHWVYTNYGWTWVSDYNWGWAPFHYGRWTHDMAYGWMWVPGYEWAPAWVSWRGGGDYYGWAPLGPGMGINVTIGSYGSYDSWCFVPRRYINSPRVNNYYVNQTKNVTIINNTTIINTTNNNINNTTVNNRTFNKTVYNAGPSATEVEKSTNMKIRPVKLVERTTPGTAEVSKNSVTIYRPPVKPATEQPVTVKPARVFNQQQLEANSPKNNVTRPNNTQQPPSQTGNSRITNPGTPQNNQPKIDTRLNTMKNNPEVNTPSQPSRTFNNEEKPAINNHPNPPVINNNPERNNPVKQQPVRNFNNQGNPSMNRQNTPAVNMTPINRPQRNNTNQPQRQLQNNARVYKQPVYQERNMRMDNVKTAPHIEHLQQQEKQPVKEKNQ